MSGMMRYFMSGQPEGTRRSFENSSRKYKTFPNLNSFIDSFLRPKSGCADTNRFGSGSWDQIPVRSNNAGRPVYYGTSLRNHPRPSRGCIPLEKVSLADARKAYQAQNLAFESESTDPNLRAAQERAFGAAIIRIQQLNGGPLEAGRWEGSRPYPIKCKHGIKYSEQKTTHIQIRMGTSTSVAQYAHEYAHLIGNKNNKAAYKAYRAYMGNSGYCMVSGYADNKPNEQFAEVFAAFVTEPTIMLNNPKTPAACRKAFNFFKNEFFKDGGRVNECMHM